MAAIDRLVAETKEEIRVLLRNPDKRPSFMTYDQLRDVQSEICRMILIRDPEKFWPYYPKGMADACWPLDHPIVKKLNMIAEIYANDDLSDKGDQKE